MRVELAKSLQTGGSDQTIWYTMLFLMMSFTTVCYTTFSIFQHISEECATVLHENNAEIRTEGGAIKTLFVCAIFVCFFAYFGLFFLRKQLLSALLFFLLVFLFCLSHTPYPIDSMVWGGKGREEKAINTHASQRYLQAAEGI